MNYEEDFYAWTNQTAQLLHDRKFDELDIEHMIEEFKDMGSSNESALFTRLEVLLTHLLKFKYQPNRRGRSWELTIKEQRKRIKKLLQKSPSLASKLRAEFDDIYEYAVIWAIRQTGLDEKHFPIDCPFSIEECLNDLFLPYP